MRERRSAPSERSRLAALLLPWFDAHRRELPWRHTKDPYLVWVSEIMLQQTQATRVIGYYERFVTAYPTVGALAAAPVDDVLRLWEGLGYYSRAHQLQEAARTVVAEYGGSFPETLEEMRKLPGIGSYTAGAVLSIARDLPLPALDTNALRVLSRVFWLTPTGSGEADRRRAETVAAETLSTSRPGDHNQALMDLATLVCRTRAPRCADCPLATMCEAYRRGEPEALPPRRGSVVQTIETVAGVVRHGEGLLLAQRPARGVWRGLWELPNCQWQPGVETPEQALARVLQAEFCLRVTVGPLLHRMRHGIMNRRITLGLYACRPSGRKLCCRTHQQACWVPLTELERYPLPAPHRKALAAVLAE